MQLQDTDIGDYDSMEAGTLICVYSQSVRYIQMGLNAYTMQTEETRPRQSKEWGILRIA
jgi:hypothetical protein